MDKEVHADEDNRPTYRVAHGEPVMDRGMKVTFFPIDPRTFRDPAEAIALCKKLRATYPDAIVVEERDVDVPGWREAQLASRAALAKAAGRS